MKWQGRRQSDNVSDQRRSSGGKIALGGGLGSIIVIGLLVFGLVTGNDTSGLINIAQNFTDSSASSGAAAESEPLTEEEQAEQDFVETILADSEDIWTQVFRENGKTYNPVELVLFSGSVQTAGGIATSATGPFYSPSEERIYVDLSFFQELKENYGARVKSDIAGESGDFVVAYVIAHEVGHHVQNQLGALDEVSQMQNALSTAEGNEWSVALELQADYYAGLFAHYESELYGALESDDIAAATEAAAAIGDDAIQEQAYGHVQPDTFTHGTSAQRSEWFARGYKSGTLAGGDTFEELGLE
jgi:predicted metalloprotease